VSVYEAFIKQLPCAREGSREERREGRGERERGRDAGGEGERAVLGTTEHNGGSRAAPAAWGAKGGGRAQS
jgi:hypothetical protein